MELEYSFDKPAIIKEWMKSVRQGCFIPIGHVLLTYEEIIENAAKDKNDKSGGKLQRLKAVKAGVVEKLLVAKGDTVNKGTTILLLGPCRHPTVMRDMCAECGMDLRKLEEPNQQTASVSMVHSVPELRVSMEQAQKLGKVDEDRLLEKRKLVLLVDLDQTLIHTTNDNVPNNINDVFHFQLWGHGSVWYHTRLRPHTHEFLESISKLYELHICTFGTRQYALTIAHQLDPSRKLFSDRILSRDECFSQNSKTANLKELFPRGDHMVCIIDDREDVWNFAPNLIHVKPYHFFRHTGDINAPPGLAKKDQDDKTGIQFDGDKVDSSLSPKSPEAVTAESDSSTKDQNNTPSNAGKPPPDLNLSEDDSENDSAKDEAAADADMEESNEEDNQKAEASNVSPSVPSSTVEESKPAQQVDVDDTDIKQESGDPKNTPSSPTVESEPAQQTDVTDIKQESEDPKITPSSEGPKITPSSEDPKITPSSEDPKITPSSEDKQSNENSTSATIQGCDDEKKSEIENTNSTAEEMDTSPDLNASVDETDNKLDKPATEQNSDIPTPGGAPKMLEVEDEDDYLLYLEQILKSIHEAFYSLHDDMVKRKEPSVPDVKTVIPYVRKKVFDKSVSIVFSGVVPTHVPLKNSKAYQIAINLGAHVSDKVIPPHKPGTSANVEPPTTHVVAARMGTAKVNEARRYKGIHVLTPEWLWTCAERWEHVEERLFRLDKAKTVKRNPPAHCSSPSPEFRREKFECITPIDGPDDQMPSTSKNPKPAMRKQRTPSGRFMDTINPLLSFSATEIETMAHEVDDIFNESESSSTDDEEEKQKERDRAARRRSSRSLSDREQQTLEDPSTSEVTKESESESSSSSSDSSDDDDDNEDGFRCSSEGNFHKKRKRDARTETETEDEPISVKFRRGEPLPSDIDGLNLMNSSSDDEEEETNAEDEWMAQALERDLLDDNSQSQDRYDSR